ncbi:hypothetical protein [Bifidobacterium olomucense]|uniref:Uncharacterized protein n=1 Tax=Bifidobacterium olomucense TaxID=2675324 RepID=A0A7Y0EZ85_9BIFI|nr:hypothetical protein [Bifidobacterium sp. DSM 109959]NMM99115.1 hypothetical protein [Bifidobacterium sp. DSM 109959]
MNNQIVSAYLSAFPEARYDSTLGYEGRGRIVDIPTTVENLDILLNQFPDSYLMGREDYSGYLLIDGGIAWVSSNGEYMPSSEFETVKRKIANQGSEPSPEANHFTTLTVDLWLTQQESNRNARRRRQTKIGR